MLGQAGAIQDAAGKALGWLLWLVQQDNENVISPNILPPDSFHTQPWAPSSASFPAIEGDEDKKPSLKAPQRFHKPRYFLGEELGHPGTSASSVGVSVSQLGWLQQPPRGCYDIRSHKIARTLAKPPSAAHAAYPRLTCGVQRMLVQGNVWLTAGNQWAYVFLVE